MAGTSAYPNLNEADWLIENNEFSENVDTDYHGPISTNMEHLNNQYNMHKTGNYKHIKTQLHKHCSAKQLSFTDYLTTTQSAN